MTVLGRGPARTRRRIGALACAALGAIALALPAGASAADEMFCVGVYLNSGQNCSAVNAHTLQSVEGWVLTPGNHRICAASSAWTDGPLNSNWVCSGNSMVVKYLNGRAFGVGTVHNGAPYGWGLWFGAQVW